MVKVPTPGAPLSRESGGNREITSGTPVSLSAWTYSSSALFHPLCLFKTGVFTKKSVVLLWGGSGGDCGSGGGGGVCASVCL